MDNIWIDMADNSRHGRMYGWDDQVNMVSNRREPPCPTSQDRVAGFEGWAGGPRELERWILRTTPLGAIRSPKVQLHKKSSFHRWFSV